MRRFAFVAVLAFATPAAAIDIGVVSAATSRLLPPGRELQLGERIVTGPNDRLDLLFVDGTSVTIGADSALLVNRFDRGGSSSTLELGAERGTLRIVGGAPDAERTVRIVTPSATVDLKNGIATVEVADRTVVATFLQGDSMAVTGQGRSHTATRIGSQISVVGGLPGPPRVVSPDRLTGHERFERAATDPSLHLFGISGTILRPRVGDVQGAAEESVTALTSNPDNSSNTPSGSFKPPTTIGHPHSNPAHAAVSHHTTGTHTGKLKTK
jgi:hypothetical protein